MLSKTHSRAIIIAGIFCFGLVIYFTDFVDAGEISGPKYVLCGHITDSKTGQPVTDAIVETRGGPISSVPTDNNGFYCFNRIDENGDYRIGIDSNEYAGIYSYDTMPIVNLSSDKQVVRDFKLDRACMIKVQIVDEANQPIESAEISVASLADERMRNIGSDMRRNRSDKEGFCLIGGIPPAKTPYLITATHSINIKSPRKDEYRTFQRQWDYAPGMLKLILNDTEVVESGRIVLQKGIDVNGIAQYQDIVPASDLKISAYPDWWQSYHYPESYPIDANGYFTLRHIVPGIYRLMADMPTGKGSSTISTLSQITLPLPNDEILKVTIPQKSPQALASIRGKVVFDGDNVLNYVHIQAYSPKGGHHLVDIGRGFGRDACDTNFVIDRLEPGKYKLTFSGQNIEQKVLEDIKAPSEGLVVELSPAEKINLKGTVINPQTGKPIQKFKARAKKTKILRGTNYSQPDKWIEFDSAEGRFNIEATGPGIYQVQIAAEGFAWTWSEDVNTDKNAPVVIKLTTGGGIKGRVVNEAGKPVNGAGVLPLSMAGGVRIQMSSIQDPFISDEGAVQTAADGTFELKHLAAGKESIKVIHPDYAYSTVNDIEVKEGQTTENIKVVMPGGGIAQGYVYDTEGRPKSNVTLYFQDIYSMSDEKTGRLATVTTDANGYYRTGGLPEQPLTVRRQKEGDNMGVVSRTLVPINGKVSRIDFGGRPIVTGCIIINGVQLANRRIVLSTIESPSSDIFRCFVMTGPDGSFAFGGIPDGKWSVYSEDIGKRGEWIKITKVDVAGQNVDLGTIPVIFSTARISIEYEPGESKWDISRSYLQEGNKPWGLPIAQLSKPDDENVPYIVKNVPLGEYYLVLMRKDLVTLRKPITVTENDANIIVRIPKCTAGIAGLMTGKFAAGQTFWREDKAIVAYARPDANAHYKFDNLPAGRYLLGGNMLIDSGALLEFELADGEQKVLDVNVPDAPTQRIGALQVMILDENGALIPGAEVRLQSSAGVIKPVDDSSQGVYFTAEPGTYTLQVNFPGYKTATQQVSVESFDSKTVRNLRKPVLVRLVKK
jgi:hypothetical protein